MKNVPAGIPIAATGKSILYDISDAKIIIKRIKSITRLDERSGCFKIKNNGIDVAPTAITRGRKDFFLFCILLRMFVMYQLYYLHFELL